VLYEMITGVAAFNGDTPVAVALKQIREYPKRPREIEPRISRAIEAVIMKCLQKDPAKRYQIVEQLEIALVKAAKAIPLRPWEAALNRWFAQAELEIRNHLRHGTEKAKVFMKRQDRRPLIKIQEDPTAMLGVTGIVAALAVFLLFGAWKPRTINAQTVQVANRNSLSPIVAVNGSYSGYTSHPPLNSDPNHGLASKSATPLAASSEQSRIVKRVKLSVGTDERKPHSETQASTPLQPLASPTQPEVLISADAPKSDAQVAAANSLQPNNVPEPAIEPVKTLSQPKTGGETKAPQLYFEVGTFKDETWASNAVDKLTQLGFHAVLIHKTLLWSQSYHVEVGPYTNKKDLEEVRQSLASQGFKAHPVN
jgi:cell division protein FtsN